MRIPISVPSVVIIAILILCVLQPTPSASHGLMTIPASRALGTPNEDYQYCFGTPGCECGEFPNAGAITATYEAGQTIQVTIDITLSHEAGAVFRFQLCPPDQLSPDCFVAGEFATTAYDLSLGPRIYEIDLPADLVCDPCVLRWKWDYGFLSCADVRIVTENVENESLGWTALKAQYR